jgi:hypothetical protein
MLALADVMEPAVVADGDDAGGVDFVVAYAVVRWDLLAGGQGFGPVVERLDGGAASRRPVWANAVVVGQECVDLVLQLGDGRRRGQGPQVLFPCLVEGLDLAAGLRGDTGVSG